MNNLLLTWSIILDFKSKHDLDWNVFCAYQARKVRDFEKEKSLLVKIAGTQEWFFMFASSVRSQNPDSEILKLINELEAEILEPFLKMENDAKAYLEDVLKSHISSKKTWEYLRPKLLDFGIII